MWTQNDTDVTTTSITTVTLSTYTDQWHSNIPTSSHRRTSRWIISPPNPVLIKLNIEPAAANPTPTVVINCEPFIPSLCPPSPANNDPTNGKRTIPNVIYQLFYTQISGLTFVMLWDSIPKAIEWLNPFGIHPLSRLKLSDTLLQVLLCS